MTIVDVTPGSIVAATIMAYEENSLLPIDSFSIQSSLEKGDINIFPVQKDKIVVIKVDPSIYI